MIYISNVFSIHGKEDLLEGRSWCWGIQEDLWWKQEERKSPTTLLWKQWCHCPSHSTTVAGDEHCWCWPEGVSTSFLQFASFLVIINSLYPHLYLIFIQLRSIVLRYIQLHLTVLVIDVVFYLDGFAEEGELLQAVDGISIKLLAALLLPLDWSDKLPVFLIRNLCLLMRNNSLCAIQILDLVVERFSSWRWLLMFSHGFEWSKVHLLFVLLYFFFLGF